jgi:hypothetical protein
VKRDDIDLHAVRHEHTEIHDRLENWRLWQAPRGGSNALPMFKFYRDGYHEIVEVRRVVDEIDALAVQVAFAAPSFPVKHRHAIGWAYVKPGIPVHVVCRVLAVNRRDLAELLHAARSMLKNTCKKRLTGIDKRV